MAAKPSRKKRTKVETLRHAADKRKNIPTAELQSYMRDEEAAPKRMRYPRNPDLDPQLVWRGKDEQDSDDLIVDTVPIYIQEKVQPKAIIDDLKRISKKQTEPMADLFADFNGLPDAEAKLEFYEHDANWSNRMILGDSLLVMNSLAEKEGLKGQVQMIYIDPPYGIKFASNWQASTKNREVKEGKTDHLSREPEVIKAFRDTWELGIHSYLPYLRDRFTVAHKLLADSGSIFVQIGDENLQLIRSVLDEVFGSHNFVVTIPIKKKGSQKASLLSPVNDYLVWFAKEIDRCRDVYSQLYEKTTVGAELGNVFRYVTLPDGNEVTLTELKNISGNRADYSKNPALVTRDFPNARLFTSENLTAGGTRKNQSLVYRFMGRDFDPGVTRGLCWKHTVTTDDGSPSGLDRLTHANRLFVGEGQLRLKRYANDFGYTALSNWWDQLGGAPNPRYVVETNPEIIKRCILMTTRPGQLVMDPTCGGGTTAYVAEQWGRRWITIDTSRVALALARQRLMAARFPYYFLKDSKEGAEKEAEITGKPWPERNYRYDIRFGFVYERAPHITSSMIANNAEIDVIFERWQKKLEPLRNELNALLGTSWQEWEIPRELDETHRAMIDAGRRRAKEEAWNKAKGLHAQWWEGRRKRQEEIDASIARNADVELLYDRPFEAKNTVRVTGPFTVESLSPHRVLPTDENDAMLEALEQEAEGSGRPLPPRTRKPVSAGEDDFVAVVLENLKAAGVHNTKKNEQLEFISLKPWAGGKYVHAEGRYMEGDKERRAAVCIGPEYGTVSYALVREAAREAVDLFDTLVVCGFAFEPQVGEDTMSLGRLTVLKAHMNQDLHMAEHLKKTGAGHLFVVFGEPEIEIRDAGDGQARVEIKGVDVFDPTTGEVRSGSTDDIACWFIDTNYDGESFFVRHAYFLGAKDPYERLKRTLKAEIDEEAWATLYSATSRPFPKPATGRIAVKVINHYGDEVLKVYKV